MDFSDEMMDEIFRIFQVESEEIISKINNSLLELEKRPNNKDAILMLFRDAHSLKGASRMVGFNNVQTLAHKMEDILGLAKENKLIINSDIINILYKTTDILADLIEKSVGKGKEVYTEDISRQIGILENTKNSADEEPIQEPQIDFDAEKLLKNVDKINSIIVESLVVLMEIEQKTDENSIKELLSMTKKLYDIFDETGPYDIKKCAEDIKVKLEFTTKGSNSLTIDETGELHQELDIIINKLISIYEIYNIEEIDYYEQAFKILSQKTGNKPSEETQLNTKNIIDETVIRKKIPELIIESKEKEEVLEEPKSENITPVNNVVENVEIQQTQTKPINNLHLIQERFNALAKNSTSLSGIKTLLMDFDQNCTDKDIKIVIQKVFKLLNYLEENEIHPNDEIISVFQQCIQYCNNTMNNIETFNKEFLLQRLDILQQVLELNKKTTEEKKLIIPKDNKIKTKNLTDFSEIFTAGEIKTLRVDSVKLDVLVNQINELTITKIKTKKHLQELGIINKELEEWQKSSIKALNYLKYYDKKYFQSGLKNNPVSYLAKQLLSLFEENNQKVQDAVSNVSLLHKTIQEDDIKMGLIVDDVEGMVKNIRILPLATVFHLFGRMVRDIAQEKNKKIEFEVIGSETCTDKKIIEEIKNPLIHIIRNSIDHGIETPEERAALGKNPVGKIVLSAHQANNKVIIEIKDDGRGINLEKIKEKALQKGFLTQEELNSMNSEQITNIIFAPGFSTGEEITNISGRGIGLDVVQTKITQLNGRVKIISELNRGCIVQIELPTTMSILKAFLVKSANQIFAIPMEVISTVLRKNKTDIISSNNKNSIIFNNQNIPLLSLANILNLPATENKSEKETILIIECDEKIMAISVDKLIGDQEILHKKLAPPIYKLKNISGITTLDTGEICLILNISDILKAKTKLPKHLNMHSQNALLTKNYYNILLVDDSITTRTMAKNILTQAGYKTQMAENPIEAFELLKKETFDLIISDVEMPEMDGFTFLEKLKTDEKFSDIPVIMISSLNLEENKKHAIDLGAEKYIVKGEFNQEEFEETICKIFEKRI